MKQIRYFIVALQMYTRLPLPASLPEPEELRAAARYLPAVGILQGFVWFVAFGLTYYLTANATLAAVVLLFAGIFFTGAFHEDGLVDFFDSLGGYTAERRLEIMKDSRVGTFGVLAAIIVILLKVITIAHLAPRLRLIELLLLFILTSAVARFMALTITINHQYISPPNAARNKFVTPGLSWAELAIALTVTVAPLLLVVILTFLYGPSPEGFRFFALVNNSELVNIAFTKIAILLLTIIAIRLLIGRFIRRAFGGYTGDILGATEQIMETVILFMAVVTIG